MRLGRLTVSNYRAIRHASVDFDDVTIFIGENNAGKSAFLSALNLFFEPSPRVKQTDFHAGEEKAIEITIEFVQFTPSERELFQSNLIDGRLIVTRTFHASLKESGGYSVDRLVNPEFSACRDEKGRAKRDIYETFREKYGLPKVSRAEDIDGLLDRWEHDHPASLQRDRVGGFRGFTNVAAGALRKNTDFQFIPAVKDAGEDIGHSKASPVKELIDVVARQTIQNSAEFKTFVDDASQRLRELTAPDAVPGLADINGALTNILSRYYGRSQISATWQPVSEVPLSMPTAEIAVVDHGYTTTIDRVGHGLQRAIILTVLQYLAERRANAASGTTFTEAQSDIIIAIEEPELYQHPTKQRLFKEVFKSAVQSFNHDTGIRVQIVYTTHSPLLFDFQDFAKVRAIRRSAGAEIPAVTVACSSLATVSQILARSRKAAPPYTDAALLARLHVFNSDIAEGFFGRVVVLIEGPSDKAILEAYYKTLGRDPVGEGIVFASVEGKSKLDRPCVVFSTLGVPIYLVFDSDKKCAGRQEERQKVELNRQLQALCGLEDDEIQDWPCGAQNKFCSWETKIEDYLEECAGTEHFRSVVHATAARFEIERDDCFKTPAVASSCFVAWNEKGIQFPLLGALVKKIDRLGEI